MLNQVNLMGRLTQDPILRQTETGRDVTNIMLACSGNYVNREGRAPVDYVEAVVWGGLAHTVFENLSKGDLIVLEGHLCQIKRADSVGCTIYQLQLVADRVHFTGKRPAAEHDQPQPVLHDSFAEKVIARQALL